jgi:putative membrane protein insertion efficiency factor
MTMLLRALVRGYQLGVRPWLPPLCRYQPSCSAYALEALQMHGPLRGVWLSTQRICRCHPWRAGGYDPVPLPATMPPAASPPSPPSGPASTTTSTTSPS